MEKTVTRSNFVKTAVRLFMAGLLAFIAITLGKRVVNGSNCAGCSGYGVCNSSNDCECHIYKR